MQCRWLVIAGYVLLLGASLGLIGCGQAPPEAVLPPPAVTVSYPGDGNFGGSSAANPATLTVSQASTALAMRAVVTG